MRWLGLGFEVAISSASSAAYAPFAKLHDFSSESDVAFTVEIALSGTAAAP